MKFVTYKCKIKDFVVVREGTNFATYTKINAFIGTRRGTNYVAFE